MGVRRVLSRLPSDVARATEEAQREYWGRVLAATLRLARDLDIAEEATADAFLLALQTWPGNGIPASVEAWLLTVARRRAVDRIRRAATLRERLTEMAATEVTVIEGPEREFVESVLTDDELRLVVLCCHPSLNTEAQVALTLRLGCGATTSAIAAGFLVSEVTMAARLTRAKKRIASSGVDVELPDDRSIDDRMPVVRRAVQLAYTLGHTAASGTELRDDDLAARAVHLARSLARARPEDRENAGLLGLLLLSQARAGSRLDAAGDQVLLEDEDRSAWDGISIAEGLRCTDFAMAATRAGSFALQAAIAAEHARSASFGATDWSRIVDLYGRLLSLEPSPTIALGRSLALSYEAGPAAGLADLDEVMSVSQLDGYCYAHAARAQLLDRIGRTHDARRAWVRAASTARTDAEREFFQTQASRR
ncbi:MAG: RNA polymerase sigma factor [Geodermatophilaceae bacterium]|nr:RNA polymerase sigma factor [Geodermatophilaceae bacterium]